MAMTNMSVGYRALSWSAAFAAVACGAEPSGEPLPGETSEAITGGAVLQPFENTVTIPPNQSMPPHGAAVSISGCTGVKIGARRFLTASHCLGGPSTVTITNGLARTPTTTYTVAAIYHHPSHDLALGLPTSCTGGVVCPGAYDIAVVDITANTSHIPVIPIAAFKIGGGVFTHMTGYGCDNVTPANGDKKQRGAMNTLTPTATDTHDIHYIEDSGNPSGCRGDSGGPLFSWSAALQNWFVVGVTAGGSAGITTFTRVANVAEWINQPTCNSSAGSRCTITPTTRLNDFVDQAGGSFINASRGACATALGKTGEDEGRDVKMYYCDGPFGDISGNPAGWRLIDTGGGTFKIVSRWSGKCLGVAGASIGTNVDVRLYACDPAGASAAVINSRRWRFRQESYHGSQQYHVVNANSGRCLGAAASLVDADVRQYTCADTLVQHWTFTR